MTPSHSNSWLGADSLQLPYVGFCNDFPLYGNQIFRTVFLSLVTSNSGKSFSIPISRYTTNSPQDQVMTLWLYNMINHRLRTHRLPSRSPPNRLQSLRPVTHPSGRFHDVFPPLHNRRFNTDIPYSQPNRTRCSRLLIHSISSLHSGSSSW